MDGAGDFKLRKDFSQIMSLEKFYSGGPITPILGGQAIAFFCHGNVSILAIPSCELLATVKVTENESNLLTAIATHPNGQDVLVVSKDLTVYHLNVLNSSVVRHASLPHQQAVTSICFDESGNVFATTSADRTMRVFDFEGLYCTHCFREFSSLVLSSVFFTVESPDHASPQLFLAGVSVSECHIYELYSKRHIGSITEHMSGISSLLVIDDVLVTSGKDGCLVFSRVALKPTKDEKPLEAVKTLKTISIKDAFLSMESVGNLIVGPSVETGALIIFNINEAFGSSTSQTVSRYMELSVYLGMNPNDGVSFQSAHTHYKSQVAADSAAIYGKKDKVISQNSCNMPTKELTKELLTTYTGAHVVHARAETGKRYAFLVAPTSDNLIFLFDILSLHTSTSGGQQSFMMLPVNVALGDSGEVLSIKALPDSFVAVGTASHPLRIMKYSYQSSVHEPSQSPQHQPTKSWPSVLLAENVVLGNIKDIDLASLKQLMNSKMAKALSNESRGDEQQLFDTQASAPCFSFLSTQLCFGHADYITAMSVSSLRHGGSSQEVTLLATASKDNTIRLWARTYSVSAAEEMYFSDECVSYRESSDCSQLPSEAIPSFLDVSMLGENSLSRYPVYQAVAEWSCIAVLEGMEDIVTIALFCGSNNYLVAGGSERIIRLYDLNFILKKQYAGLCQQEPMLSSTPLAITVAPQFGVLAHEDIITSLATSPDGVFVMSASADLSLKTWKIPDGQSLILVSALQKICKRNIWYAEYSAYQRIIVAGCGDRKVRILSLQDNEAVSITKTLEGHLNAVMMARFFNHGQQLASVGADGLIKVWSIVTGECVSTIKNATHLYDLGLDRGQTLKKMWSLETIEDPANDAMLLLTGDTDGVLRVYADTTRASELHAQRERQIRVEQEQAFMNALSSKDIARSFKLAMNIFCFGGSDTKLGRNVGNLSALLRTVTACMGGENSEDTTPDSIVEAIISLGLRRVPDILRAIQLWNHNSRTARAAQFLLKSLLRAYTLDVLVEAYGAKYQNLICDLCDYTERHEERVGKLRRSAYSIDLNLAYLE